MNIETDNIYTIYRNEYNNRVMYSTRISRKLKDGSYDITFLPVQFKFGEDIKDRTKMVFKEAWLSFFKTKDDRPVFYLFINKYNIVEDYDKIKTKSNALDSLNIEISDEDLPF